MKKISILMYHQVGRFARPPEHRAVYCDISRFKAQMAWLHHLNYHVISLQDAVDALKGNRPLSRDAVVLTFDDGYQNFHDAAFPILKRYGFPATVYLISSLIGKNAEWLAEDGRIASPLMGLETIRELKKHQITFGSHTRTHPRLTHIEPAEQYDEIVKSKAELEALLGEETSHFSYPFGNLNEDVLRWVQEAGYVSATTCIRGSVMPDDDPLVLPRKAISYGDSLAGFFWKLHMKHKKKINPEDVQLNRFHQELRNEN